MPRPFYRELPSSNSPYTRQKFTLGDMAGGLNNVDDQATILNNQAADCYNMKFSDNYGMEKRNGCVCLYKSEEETDDLYGETLTWYDEYTTLSNQTVHTITASNEKLFVDDTYICDVLGRVEGVTFNGTYYFVDGTYLYRLEEDETATAGFKTYKIISDPKYYISSFGKSYTKVVDDEDVVKTLYSTFTDTAYSEVYYNMCQNEVVDGEVVDYNADTTYYVDPFGEVPLVHGTGSGQVSASNYTNYYVKKTRTVTKKGINLYGFYTTFIPQNVSVGDVFTFNNNLIGHYTKHDIETKIDSVTGIVHYTDAPTLEAYEFIITEIDEDNGAVLFSPTTIEDGSIIADTTDVEKRRIYSEDIEDIYSNYESLTTDIAKESYLNSALTEFLGNTLCRCYTPRDDTYAVGETIVNIYGYIWYQPCKNELEYAYLGENYLPSNPRNISVFNGRLWSTGDVDQPHEIRACNVNQPYYYPAALSLAMSPNGDEVQDILEFDGSLIVGRKKDIYSIYGNSTNNSSESLFTIKKLDATTGFISSNCGSLINNFYLFLGNDGKFYKLNTPTTNTDYLMIRPLTSYIDIFEKPLDLLRSDCDWITSVAFDNCVYWSIGDKILVYSYDHQAFTYYKDLNCKCIYTNGIDLFFGGTNGSRYKFDESVWSDDGDAISAVFKTKTFSNDSSTYKYWEQLMCTFVRPKSQSASVNITVDFDKTYAKAHTIFPIAVDLTAAKFDTAKWGESTFSYSPTKKTKWLKLDARSRNIAIKFENSKLNESFKLIDVNVIYTWRDIR